MPRKVIRHSVSVAAAVAWTPASLPNLVAWYDASNSGSITQSGGSVSQWNDLSGNGWNMTQGTGANQPGTGSATINSLNVLTFNGSQYVQNATIGTTPANVSVFAVLSVDSIAGANSWLGDDPTNGGVYLRTNATTGTQELDSQGSAVIGVSSTGLTAATPALVGVTWASATTGAYQFWLNSGTDGSGTTAGTFANNCTLQIGVARSGFSGTFAGKIAEIVYSDHVWSGSDVTSLLAYLKAKWGTP